ncbi:UNVERIFIED_CONTAM: hypothetical protein FKN15_048923 [Acipenser sinensis]
MEGRRVFEQFEEKICEWMGDMNYTAEVMHVPLFLAPVSHHLHIAPAFGSVFPLVSQDLDQINTSRPDKKKFGSLADVDLHSLPPELQIQIKSLASGLNSMFDFLHVREECFAVGPTSRIIAGELANHPQAKNRRKTAQHKASVVFIDRTRDLTGAVGHHGDNLVEKILSALPELSGHNNDVMVDMLELTSLQKNEDSYKMIAPGHLAQPNASALCAALLRLVLVLRHLGFSARRCTYLDARRFGTSTLSARTSTLDARCIDARCSVHAPRRFGARRLVHRRSVHAPRCSTLGARTSTLRRSTLGARTSMLDASALDARRVDARCTHLEARRFGASTLGARTSTLRRKAVTLRGSRSPSQLTAGQRSPDRRHSPSVRLQGSSPRRERSRRSRSRSLSPRRRGRSRSPRRDRRGRDKSGVAELTSKMSQFMEVMMGQQSLLMSLTNRAPPAEPVASHSAFQPQPLAVPVVQQPQGVWDIDAISRDASEGDPLLEEDSPGTDLASQHSEHDSESEALDTSDPLWSLVERATRHLGIEWQAVELPRRSLFESPSVRSPMPRTLPAFPDFIKEVQSTWGAPASSPATSRKASAFAMQGASEAGLASFPPVDAAFAALVKTPTLSGLVKDPACPNKQCRTTEIHLKKGYLAATEAVKLSNVASLLTVYQASLIRDLPEHLSPSLKAELALVAQFLVKIAQLNARAQGRSIASLVVARRQLWLSQARVQEPDKAPLLDAPITPGHTFGPAVEEMLQRSVKAREASQQMAKMWPHKPFQPRRHQEHQWHRAPPQRQTRPGGTKTSPSATAARSQPHFSRPQRGGWRPRGGGRPRPRGSGQPPREQAQPKQP